MYNNRECANYLKKNAAYSRCMQELRKKWESYGRVAGCITLKKASEEERRAIGGIVGRAFMDETVKITFQEFEQSLQKTCFAPIDIKAVLEDYFGSSLYTNQEQKAQAQVAREEFFDMLLRYFEGCANIYYSGDLDPEGMDIADRLWQRYGDVIHLWRMTTEDYNKSISGEKLSERQLAKLEHLKNPILCCTAEAVRSKGKAGYQENLLEDLLVDIEFS